MSTPGMDGLTPSELKANKSGEVIGVAVAFIVLTTLTSILRAASRKTQKNGFMWSDLYMLISWLSNVGVCICALLAVRWGLGRHVETVPKHDIPHFNILLFPAISVVYVLAVTFPKLAILDLYLNIFVDRTTRLVIYSTAAVIAAACVGNFIAFMAQCSPVTQFWRPVPGGWCTDVISHLTWGTLPNIVTDVVMLALPIPVVVRLNARWQRRVGILLTFFIGSCGLAMSLARFIEFRKVAVQHRNDNNPGDNDSTWRDPLNIILSITEPGAYHVVGSVLTYGPLIRYLRTTQTWSSVLSATWSTLRLPSRGSSANNVTGRSDMAEVASATNHPDRERHSVAASYGPSKASITASPSDLETEESMLVASDHPSAQSVNPGSGSSRGCS